MRERYEYSTSPRKIDPNYKPRKRNKRNKLKKERKRC